MAPKRIVIYGWSESAHVQRWVRGLCGRGFSIKLISLGGPSLDFCDTCVLPRANRWSYLTMAGKAVEEARAFEPDLVHGHYATGFGYWAVRARSKPVVVSVWGADIVDFPDSRIKRGFLRAVLRRATRITATSEFLREAVKDLDSRLLETTTVIPFGVRVPEEAVPAPTAPPVKLCYIKGLKPKYGPDVLLQAMTLVRKDVPEIRLSIAGGGEMKPELLWQTVNLGLDDIVEFVGMIPNEEIYEFLQRHHVMVMPSVMDSESFGVAALEASVCERPVIATFVGGVPEVVKREETGILIPPNDVEKLAEAIVRLARDGMLRERMGRNGRVFVQENYDWEKSLDQMAELYEKLIYECGKK